MITADTYKQIICFFVLLVTGTVCLSARQVLFISSYDENFETVEPQKTGLREVLTPEGIQFDTAYMDMKNYNTPENEANFYEELRYKLQHHSKYDAVIIGDDAALHFAEKHQNELFAGIPIVFFCINDITYAQHFNANPLITGSVENFYLKDTIDIALTFHPHTTQITGLYDDALSGQGDRKQFEAIKKDFPGYTFTSIDSSACTTGGLAEKLEQLPENSILIYLSCFEDGSGNHYTIPESIRLITRHCRVPVYRTGLGGIGDGFVGGKIFYYEASGRKTAETVLAVLNGASIASLPVILDGESQYRFDYRMLKKFHVDTRLIPKGSVIINRPLSFMDRYGSLIRPIMIITIIVILILAAVFYDNRRRRRFTERIKYQAEHDYLTDLPNRRVVTSVLNNLLEHHTPITLMLLDIDDFKNINDVYGHTCGDEILVETARRLQGQMTFRKFAAFRVGGDEFLLITTSATQKQTDSLHSFIRKQFIAPVVSQGKSHYLKMSIGIAHADAAGSGQAGSLLTKADLALYSAKKTGKNTTAYFNEGMIADLNLKNSIEHILNDACENDGFNVVYQPQFDLASEKTYCYEALARLKNEHINTAQFISVAEDSDIILTIGRIITRKVIEQIARWRKNNMVIHPVSINYSSRQLFDTDYVPYLKRLLNEYSIPPSLIEIEITESVFLDNSEKALRLFKDFASLGVNLTLDDFGTGYSSISYLTYIPVRKIKLDKSLIDIYLQSGKDEFVRSIIGLAHSLGLKITVEGVETKAQYDRLKEFSCDYIQGYYISKPVSGDEIEKSDFH